MKFGIFFRIFVAACLMIGFVACTDDNEEPVLNVDQEEEATLECSFDKVIFDANGGYFEDGSVKYEDTQDHTKLKLNTPSAYREDYIFLGWSTNKEAVGATYTDFYTDISKDGMLKGPNIDGLKRIAKASTQHSRCREIRKFYLRY